jgi:hypothetical protein
MTDLRTSDEKPPTFEETYPRCEFSELVRITLAIADWMARRLRHDAPAARRTSAGAVPARNVQECFHTTPAARRRGILAYSSRGPKLRAGRRPGQ